MYLNRQVLGRALTSVALRAGIAVAIVLVAGCSGVRPVEVPTLSLGPTPTPEFPRAAGPDRAAYDRAVTAAYDDEVHFAGVLWDDGGVLHMLCVGNDSASRATVGALLPRDARVAWDQVELSYAQLRRLRDEILALEVERGTDAVAGVSFDRPASTVIVQLRHDDPAFRAALTDRYGDRVRFEFITE